MSQIDIFQESDNISQRQCVSLPAMNYRWVIIFNWHGEQPFKVFERAMFREIKDSWMKGQLKAKSRAKKLMMSSLPAQTVSLFGKIDESKIFFLNLNNAITICFPYFYCYYYRRECGREESEYRQSEHAVQAVNASQICWKCLHGDSQHEIVLNGVWY